MIKWITTNLFLLFLLIALAIFSKPLMAESKTITVDDGVLTVEQHADEGVSVGGINIDTDFPWFIDALIVLVLVALVYIGKKFIDRKFEKNNA